MTEFKGTKGKWVYDYEQESILSENGYIIADIFPVGQEANALLISKAPEMLKMLREFLAINGGCIQDVVKHKIKVAKLIKEATEI